MLYVFHVDTGTTITFDMKLALESVSQLKEAIERECGVAAGQQVLLVSGGESLEPNARVCTYSAGTDTNPIYLFSKAAIESPQPPVPSIDYGSDVDLQGQIEASLVMPATYQTVVARAQLGQQCWALARNQTSVCERLVHDQHLQQQGWAAVVANLEDITQMFQSRVELLQQSFTLYLTERQQHIELLNNFNENLRMLSKIPILPALRVHADGLLSPEDQDGAELGSNGTTTTAEPSSDAATSEQDLSLLRWISAKDNQSSLEQVAEQCSRGLEQFDERVMESLKSEVNSAIEAANKQDMKEIKGLGERLYGLEQLMFEAKKLVQEQGDLAQAFLQNQNRASNLGDASILPDLCASHKRQLQVMLQNHNHLRDIRRRCTKAKEELSVNLYQRLKWIMYVENKMMEVDGKLVMYHESLKRLRRHLEVLQQIHLAPKMYMCAVVEVVRRRTFSQAFLVWASNLACQLLTVHSEEIARRRDFQAKFDGHFLNTLFPGLEDTPPSFATQAPSVFDSALPKLTSDDMESLRKTLPDLALAVSTPDLSSITQFFLSKSLTEGSSTEGSKEKENEQGLTNPDDKNSSPRRAPLLGDRGGGFESETDTEEFEKIGQQGQTMTELKQGGVDLESFDGDTSSDKEKRSELAATAATTSTTTVNIQDHHRHHHRRRCHLSKSNNNDSKSAAATSSSSAVTRSPDGHNHPDPINNPSLINPAVCDGGGSGNEGSGEACRSGSGSRSGTREQGGQQLDSAGSSSSLENGIGDFMGTEFYMDESLPSSLSEHPGPGVDVHHQAIVSLLQENLGNTREEVERLRSVLRCMKSVAGEALLAFRQELTIIREHTLMDKSGLTELTQGVRQALAIHSGECERTLQEREQELTVDHELEMADLRKLMQSREEDIRSLEQTIVEKEAELSEHERLLTALRQKMEADQTEFRQFQSRIIIMEEAIDRANIEKDIALKESQQASKAEIDALNASLAQSQERVGQLEERLNAARAEHEEAIKAATEKYQKEYKQELENIRSRFKLMAASTMERSPSDSSLEKIERPDMIELVNHETILAKLREDMRAERTVAIRAAIDKERSDCAAKLDHELRLARQRNDAERQVWFNEAMRRVIEEKERQVETHRSKEAMLSEECERFKVESLEADKVRLEANMEVDKNVLKEREDKLKELESERDKLRGELNDERLKMSEGGGCLEEAVKMLEAKNERLETINAGTDSRLQKLEAEKDKLKAELEIHRKNDEIEVSESKKVRLESEPDLQDLIRRLELVESENKRLKSEVRMLRESRSILDSKVEALKSDNVALKMELVEERSRRNFPGEATNATTAPDPRDKDMSTSVAVIPECSSRDAATSPKLSKRKLAAHFHNKLTRSTRNLIQQSRISICTCNPGDIVLVLWEPAYSSYTVFQETDAIYLVHSDSIVLLDLTFNSDGTPKKNHTVAEVIKKEWCLAKKANNRYKVEEGKTFYRVKLKPQQKESGSICAGSSGTSSRQTGGASAKEESSSSSQQHQPSSH
ncbi:RB1-inducible coiled-coil protein 1 isoform X2 [Diprion similis]|uniref:RB1-inducible coiled-coil protein 1 isoform X2 n=1 Tax=Diprion similis TaxID=362088 RepID=UPI001EF91B7C|nr:RB1-inducible coiled-coil protein 1 isoform X2 [Diprion similis]